MIAGDAERVVFECHGEEMSITISMGLAHYEDETTKDLIKKADQALYKAKKSGRNRVMVS